MNSEQDKHFVKQACNIYLIRLWYQNFINIFLHLSTKFLLYYTTGLNVCLLLMWLSVILIFNIHNTNLSTTQKHKHLDL
jgi:hypothetical protein